MANEDVMTDAAAQAARHDATESTPSGQQGQSPESEGMLAMPIISAQGMDSGDGAAGNALASGVAEISCAATST
jgi:hypothetical protein